MRLIILALIIVAAMCMIAALSLAAEGEYLWALFGGCWMFLCLRMSGYLEHLYPNG